MSYPALEIQLFNDFPHRDLHRRILRKLHGRFSIAVILINRIILWDYSQQIQTLLFNFLGSAFIQFTVWRPVYNQTNHPGFHTAFMDQLGDSSCSLYAPAGTVAHQYGCLHSRQDTPADMFHSRFVVYNDIGIIVLKFGKLCLQKTVYITVWFPNRV